MLGVQHILVVESIIILLKVLKLKSIKIVLEIIIVGSIIIVLEVLKVIMVLNGRCSIT